MDWSRRRLLGAFAVTVLPLPASRAALGAAGQEPLVLRAAPAHLRLRPSPAPETPVLAFNGQVPGPLIRVTKGQPLHVRLENGLDQPTTLSWHGVRIANAMDGVAGLTQPAVLPGQSFNYRFTPPDAGLYWYHPLLFPQGATQTDHGLYGALVVEDPDRPKVDLDLLLVIADWALTPTAGIADSKGADRLVTANSHPLPLPPISIAPRSRVRLGLLNVCAERIAFVGCAGCAPLVIAIDGQPSELFPPAAGTLPIGPGARFEVLLDMSEASKVKPNLFLRGERGPDQPLLSFALGASPVPPHPAPTRLPPNPRLPSRIPLERSLKVNLTLAETLDAKAPWRWTINGIGSDGTSGKPLFRVRRNGAVTLAFINKTSAAQQMHVHGHAFRVLHDLDDGWDPYWRDSILLGPGKTKHVAFIADNPGKWLIESAIRPRQESGLTGWFEVT